MGTYHSFVSEPFRSELEAQAFKKDVCQVIENSRYRNSPENFSVLQVNCFYLVVGVYKNLGSAPIELDALAMEYDWATVSDEKDFFNSEK